MSSIQAITAAAHSSQPADDGTIVDALPYFDQGYDDAARQEALALIKEEAKNLRPPSTYLKDRPIKIEFETPLMSAEFERIAKQHQMEPLSMKRYELPAPPPNKLAELAAWQDSIENSMAQLEHQTIRGINLDLMLDYGCETWKIYLEVLTADLAKAQKRLDELKAEVNTVNQRRKDKQLNAGAQLKALEAQWVSLVFKNYTIEEALRQRKDELEQKKRELENDAASRKSHSAQRPRNAVDADEVVHNGQGVNGSATVADEDNENASSGVREQSEPPMETHEDSMDTNTNADNGSVEAVGNASDNSDSPTEQQPTEAMETEWNKDHFS